MTELMDVSLRATNGLHEVQTETGPIHYRIDGRIGGPWLVFSNSHATNLSMWDRQVEVLAADFRILRYDQRGHGETPPLDEPCRFDGLCDDLIVVMNAAGARSAVLIGISMGAVTVLRTAARFPDQVVAVIAADGQWRSPPNADEIWQMRIDIARRLGSGALSKPTIDRWFHADIETTDRGVFDAVNAMIENTPSEGYIGCAQAMQSYDFSKDFPGLRMPVLYLVGARDGAMPATMQQMAEATPDARFVSIPDAGHLPNLEQPGLFLEAIVPFLSDVTRAERQTNAGPNDHA